MNPNDEYVVLVQWHVESGTRVAAEQVLVTVETTKATFDISAPVAGYAFYKEEVNSLVDVGAAVAWVAERDEAPDMSTAVEPAAGGAAPADGQSRFSRKALKLMKQHGLGEADFPPSVRIGTAEVEQRVREGAGRAADVEGVEGVEALAQSPAKILEVARLGEVYAQVIPSTVAISVPSAALNDRLTRLAPSIGSLSVLELVIHDAARVLCDFPELNGFYAGGRASRYTDVHIGFAVNLGKALRVPIVRNAATLTLTDVARAVRDLSLRYMRGELTAADVSGGTFTVTDLSARDVVHFIPVLNHAQSAILGICAERPGAGYRELVLTFDHRMSDGMRAAEFLLKLRERLVDTSSD
jgi:pyruvate/2-oxoglutarate dehydrogenase complex dihydrolipoamide acyltransferase (E2) component